MKIRNTCLKTIACASLLTLSSSLLAQSWLWGATGYCEIKANDNGSPVATDKNGNAYYAGQYQTTIIFEADTLSCAFLNEYLVKYNPAGNVIWAKQPIDSLSSESEALAVATSKSGTIYVTGACYGTVQFGVFTLRSGIYNANVFLAKYDGNGNVLWARQSFSPSSVSTGVGYGVSTDKSGNIFITGEFKDTISFGSFRLASSFTNLYNVFIVKYDSNGNVLWAKQSVSPSFNADGEGYSVTADNAGNAYIAGYFIDSLIFGSHTLITTYYPESAFLVKYSPAGTALWAEQSLDVSANSQGWGYAVITDQADDPYLTGYFKDTVKFGTHTVYSPSGYSVFLSKYDTGGNALWAKQSSSGWIGSSLASDGFNNVYLTGTNTKKNTTLSFGSYTLFPNPWDSNVSFLVKFDSSGNPLCGSLLNGLGYLSYYTQRVGVAADSTGNYVYTGGTYYDDSVICSSDTFIVNNGGENAFAARWNSCNSEEGTNKLNANGEELRVFPNPSTGIFTLQLSGVETSRNFCGTSLQIFNVLGEMVYSTPNLLPPNGGSASFSYPMNISSQPNGIYFYRVLKDDATVVGAGKIIVER